MRNSITTTLATLVASTGLCNILLAPSRAAAADKSTMQAGIQAAYDGMGDAFGKHDISRLMSFFSPEYVNINEKGRRLNKDQTRRGFEQQLSQIKTVKGKWVIINVTPTGGDAEVEMRMHSAGTGEKRILFARFKGTFSDDLWVKDIWTPSATGWHLQHRQTLRDNLDTHVF